MGETMIRTTLKAFTLIGAVVACSIAGSAVYSVYKIIVDKDAHTRFDTYTGPGDIE